MFHDIFPAIAGISVCAFFLAPLLLGENLIANILFSDPQSSRKPTGTVYVIQDTRTGLYKIGITNNMQRRMRELGVGKTSRLVDSKPSSNPRAVERAAHQRYKAHRLPQTEYFLLKQRPQI